MISYVLPTRDRPQPLAATLEGLARLHPDAHRPAGGAEVVVVDNASTPPVRVPATLANGLGVRLLRRDRNEGAAARNHAVDVARGEWIVMLDDDSFPLDGGHVAALCAAPEGVAAIGGEILLPDGTHEAGGLPEVFVGCGAAVRRAAFLDAGGYDPDLGFYVEEYDLCARLLAAGLRVEHDWRLRVLHRKVGQGRDMDLILERLVRNNGWVALRYAPRGGVERELDELIARYAGVAVREGAAAGFARGLRALRETAPLQVQSPLGVAAFERFVGLAAVRDHLSRCPLLARASRVALVEPGRNEWVVRQALESLGVELVEEDQDADALVIGTLSPGPMVDAWVRRSLVRRSLVRRSWSRRSGSRRSGSRGHQAVPPVLTAWIPHGAGSALGAAACPLDANMGAT